MTLENIYKLSRYNVFGRSTDTTYADADLLMNTNKNYRKLEARAMSVSPSWQPRATYAEIDLIADVYKYDIDKDIWRVNRLEAKFNSASKYQIVTPIDLDNIKESLETYAPDRPEFDLRDGFLTVFTDEIIEDVTDGLKLYVQKNVTSLLNTTDEPDIVEPFADLLALYNAKDYFLPNEVNSNSEKIERDIIKREAEFDKFMRTRQIVPVVMKEEEANFK